MQINTHRIPFFMTASTTFLKRGVMPLFLLLFAAALTFGQFVNAVRSGSGPMKQGEWASQVAWTPDGKLIV
ncbi:MAG: hypothetical protein JO314_12140, partial [Acidobacteria bacterium]|nr:hypothetical protein [Acidobacteriota bacterium]